MDSKFQHIHEMNIFDELWQDKSHPYDSEVSAKSVLQIHNINAETTMIQKSQD
jgi:hypothetical protein